MSRRKSLVLVTAGLLFVGMAFIATAFNRTLLPNEVAVNAQRVTVKLADIPSQGALEVEYFHDRAFVVRSPELAVFLFPFFEGTYRLTDGTWGRPLIRCAQIIFEEAQFSCNDESLAEQWLEQTRWTATGASLGTWMPDLQRAPFIVEGGTVVISPEYRIN